MTTYDDHTALLVVDVQNDFADPAGSLYVAGAEDIIDVVNAEQGRARDAGATVVYTQDWHPPVTPHFRSSGGVWPDHCVQGTWGAAFHPDLEVDGPVVRKGTGGEDGYSGFTVRDPTSGDESATMLEHILRDHDVERIVIAGLATDYCVKETALDAVARGFDAVVIEDAIRAVDVDPGDGRRALEELVAAGVVVA